MLNNFFSEITLFPTFSTSNRDFLLPLREKYSIKFWLSKIFHKFMKKIEIQSVTSGSAASLAFSTIRALVTSSLCFKTRIFCPRFLLPVRIYSIIHLSVHNVFFLKKPKHIFQKIRQSPAPEVYTASLTHGANLENVAVRFLCNKSISQATCLCKALG